MQIDCGGGIDREDQYRLHGVIMIDCRGSRKYCLEFTFTLLK